MKMSSNDPLVSIIIPCYNAQNWIFETLSSAYDQKNIDSEIIVVNDGSTDSSVSLIKKYFPNVKLININNSGPSTARNVGFENSDGKYIKFLDADDLLEKDKIEKQLKQLIESGADVSYGNWKKLKKNSDGEFFVTETVIRKLTNPETDLFTNFWCPIETYLFTREIVKRTCGYRVNLPIIQDARFVLDCALCGGKFVYCDDIIAYYRIHEKNLSRQNRKAFIRDCYTNFEEIEAFWHKNGGITPERKKAMIRVLGFITRSSFVHNLEIFGESCNRLLYYEQDYVPEGNSRLAILSKYLGYKNALIIYKFHNKIRKLIEC